MARSRTHCENTEKVPFVGILHTSDEQAVVWIPPEGTFEVNSYRIENMKNDSRPFPFQNTFSFFGNPVLTRVHVHCCTGILLIFAYCMDTDARVIMVQNR